MGNWQRKELVGIVQSKSNIFGLWGKGKTPQTFSKQYFIVLLNSAKMSSQNNPPAKVQVTICLDLSITTRRRHPISPVEELWRVVEPEHVVVVLHIVVGEQCVQLV